MIGARVLAAIFGAASIAASPLYAAPSPRHCIALYGECKYKLGFAHFDYVNPAAPKGGTLKLSESGTFDTLNPLTLKGVKAPALLPIFESLMVPSLDEPESLYGLLAESITLADDRTWAEFVLRKEAKWSDGTPVTTEDVVFSLEMMKTKADPSMRIVYAPVEKAEVTGPQSVKFIFSDPKNRELPLMAAQLPIVSKAYYSTRDFEETSLEPPVTTAAYLVDQVDPGRSISYRRNPDYWGKDLPVNRGLFNFDVIRYDMYRDENVSLEAFKAGAYDFRQEYIARNWATAYDSPALKDGRFIKTVFPDMRPQGMQAFLFNVRKREFSDPRVRQAIGLSMDYEWLNKTIFYGAYTRNTSFFMNTPFAATSLPEGKELELLERFACIPRETANPPSNMVGPPFKPVNQKSCLPEALFTEEFKVPTTDGSGNARADLLKAQQLLNDAGWKVKDGKRVNEQGEQLSVEFLLRQPTMERVAAPMRKNMERLGIASSIRYVDDAQYQKRLETGDFDLISIWINRGVFYPGNEQYALWHSSQADIPGSNNVGGVKNPAVDAALEKLLAAKDEADLTVAGRALDRVLLWEYYTIPHWYSATFRIAYWDKFGLPDVAPPYALALHAWWMKEEKHD